MKTRYNTIILGAGIGGLGVGAWIKTLSEDFIILEKEKEIPLNLHNGVHYLHSIPDLPYEPKLKEITLTDGVLTQGEIKHTASLEDALLYSEKVRAIQHPSSIFEVGKKESVFVPKSNDMNDFIKEMVDWIVKDHIQTNTKITKIDVEKKRIEINEEKIEFENLITTLPLRTLVPDINLQSTPIEIFNFKVNKIVPNWLINLYIPDKNQKPYRISILNNKASVESIELIEKTDYESIRQLFRMFYINLDEIERSKWKEGKIISIDIDSRRKILEKFIPKDIFLLGRFGLWDQKLLIDSTIRQAKEIAYYLKTNKYDKERLIDNLSHQHA